MSASIEHSASHLLKMHFHTLPHFLKIGLMLVPYGKLIGKRLGDRYPREEMLAEHTNRPGGRMTGLIGNQTLSQDEDFQAEHASHPWGIFFTVLGTVLLDFDADACQSPSRAYLLDVTLPGRTKKVPLFKNEQHYVGTYTLPYSIYSLCWYISLAS